VDSGAAGHAAKSIVTKSANKSSLTPLIFDVAERGADDELKFQFEAVSRMPVKERDAVRTLLEALIVKSQVTGVLEGVAKRS
jgi:hypothetical protein